MMEKSLETGKDTDSPMTGDSSPSAAADSAPKNVSRAMWERFQAVQKRRQTITHRSTAKRIKKLQEQITQKVSEELQDPAKPQNQDVRLSDGTVTRSQDGSAGTNSDPGAARDNPVSDQDTRHNIQTFTATSTTPAPSSSVSENQLVPPSSSTENWLEVKPFLTVNDHLRGVDRGKCAPKCKLEKTVDAAIELGDMDAAERLSDKLSTREFGKKIADAFDAKRYAEAKKKENDLKKRKKKKKLNWGFQHKERWETKGNM